MLTRDQEIFILENAYVPEHIVGLMTYLSGGEPFLVDGYFYCRKDDWVILVGYPLNRGYQEAELASILEKMRKSLRFTAMWVIAPKLPLTYEKECRERESDYYFTLGISDENVPGELKRTLNKAQNLLEVNHSRETEKAHLLLSQEFIERSRPQPRIKELLLKSLDYARHSEKAMVLNAWDKRHELSAFYVIDLSAQKFATYVIGCHSKVNYVPGASDLLLYETIRISAAMNKPYLHLGLGVNEGIRRFKRKWGGKPTLPYEMGGAEFKRSGILNSLMKGHLT